MTVSLSSIVPSRTSPEEYKTDGARAPESITAGGEPAEDAGVADIDIDG